MKKSIYDAIIIGAGHNGLVAANYLSKANKKVLVLQQRNIVGGAAFYERFHKLAFRPGAYGKMGLLFDFASDNARVRSLEIGVSVDVLFPPIQQMYQNEAKKAYIEAYIAYNFGSKKLLYEK